MLWLVSLSPAFAITSDLVQWSKVIPSPSTTTTFNIATGKSNFSPTPPLLNETMSNQGTYIQLLLYYLACLIVDISSQVYLRMKHACQHNTFISRQF